MENFPIYINSSVGLQIMKLQDRILPKLRRVLNYYNHCYNLNIDIVVDNNYNNCCFNHDIKSIVMSFTFITYYFNTVEAKRRHIFNDIDELSLVVFLHEVKHALDYFLYRELYNTLEIYSLEFKKNEMFGLSNKINYEQLPLEARADMFAHNEIEKWIKKGD